MTLPTFFERLRSELELLLSHEKSAPDFVGRFYILVDEKPVLPNQLQALFEDFHYQVANFEPRKEVRELGLIDEEQLREKARAFLIRLREIDSGAHEVGDLGSLDEIVE